jgi:hypothetical protein
MNSTIAQPKETNPPTTSALHNPKPQPTKVTCIEYPREPGKDEQYAWVCLFKAAWVADALLGVRTQVRPAWEWSCVAAAGWRQESSSKLAPSEILPQKL